MIRLKGTSLMKDYDTSEAGIIPIDRPAVTPAVDAYSIELRHENYGVRRTQSSALVGPLFPSTFPTNALASYSPRQLMRAIPANGRPHANSFQKFTSLIAKRSSMANRLLLVMCYSHCLPSDYIRTVIHLLENSFLMLLGTLRTHICPSCR